jgi:hypothetical protein
VAATIALDVDFQFAVGRLDTGFLSFERIEAGQFVTKGRKVNTEKIRCIAGPESIDYRLNTPVLRGESVHLDRVELQATARMELQSGRFLETGPHVRSGSSALDYRCAFGHCS